VAHTYQLCHNIVQIWLFGYINLFGFNFYLNLVFMTITFQPEILES